MLTGFPPEEIDRVYALCKMAASTDGAFPEPLLLAWFEAAWSLCAAMVGLYPPEQIKERIFIDYRGGFQLSRQPTGPIEVYAGYTRVAVIGPPYVMTPCDPSLCCMCDLTVKYMTGSESCEIPPRFIQAVLQLFAYMVENRGDTPMDDDQVLTRSGAKGFLAPDLVYVL